MTIHNITSEVIDTSVVYGPYASDTGAAWIKVKLNSVIINAATQQAMFNDNVTVLIERTDDDGETYEHFGHIVWYGYTDVYQPRDGIGDYAEFWVNIKEDGWKYRVTITTDATDEIYGEIEFDTVSSRLNPSHGNGGVDIADSYFFRIHGSGGHGTSAALEVSGPIVATRDDNCTFLTVANLGQINFVYPDYVGLCIVSIEGTSTGDHTVAKWGGSSGDAMTRSYTAGNNCYIASYFYTHVNPDSAGSVFFRFVPDDISAWLSGGEEGEVRDLSPVPAGTFATFALKNTKQSDPVGNTYRSSDIASAPWPPDTETQTQVASGNITTNPGDLIIMSAGNVFNPQDVGEFPGRELDWTISGEEVLQLRKIWDEAQSDEWDQVIGYQEADSGDNSSAVSASITWNHWPGYYVDFAYFQYLGAITIQETKYCHLVIVETPGDEADLPDANQIRLGNDGFDASALYYTKRGPDADGTVRFDPTSIPGLGELTDVTFCAVYDDGAVPLYFNQTTAQAIHCVAVEDPGSPGNYPNTDQIKAGTDYLDAAAPYVKKLTLPLIDGTEQFGSFAGLDPDTDYLFAFVTGAEAPVYYQASTLGAALLEAFGTTQTQESETVGLIQASTLAAVGTSQDQTSQNSDLAQANTLSAQNTTQSQTSQNSGLTVAGQLGVQDTSQAQASQNSDLIIQYSLSVNNTTQSQTSGEVSLELSDALVVPATAQVQTSDQISLVQSNILQAGNTSQTQSSQNTTLGDRIPGALIAEEIRIIPAIGSQPIRAMPALSSTPRIIGPN